MGLKERISEVPGGGKRLGVGAQVMALTWERLMDNKDIVGRWQEVPSSQNSRCASALSRFLCHSSPVPQGKC